MRKLIRLSGCRSRYIKPSHIFLFVGLSHSMEVAGVVLGGVSILALFGTAQDGLRLILSVRHDLLKESNYLVTKLQIEHHKLQVWGRYMGLSEIDGQCRVFNMQPKPTQSLCISILAQVSAIFTDAKALQRTYGLEPVDATNTDDINFREDLLESGSVERVLEAIRKHQSRKAAGGKKLRWAIKDQSKFEKLLTKFSYLNDSLSNCLSPFGTEFLKLSLPTFILPSINDPHTLRQLHSRETDQQFLTSSADLLRMSIENVSSEMQNAPNLSPSVEEHPSTRFDAFENEDDTRKDRCLADYCLQPSSPRKKRVLIEWRSFDNVSVADRTLVTNRLLGLARVLTATKLPEFRILPCIGILKDDPRYANKLGFIFDLPSDNVDSECLPLTLYQMLKNDFQLKSLGPFLGDRFVLAQKLASALALFHASKWLHKGLFSQNILFFRQKDAQSSSPLSIKNPYIGGFDYARPDRPGEVSGPGRLFIEAERNVYRHPDVQNEPVDQPDSETAGNSVASDRGSVHGQNSRATRFQKIHDIYSLGVILYEIGIWRPALEEYLRNLTPEDFRVKLVESCSELGPRMGMKYEQVVRRRLSGDFGNSTPLDDGKLQRAFWSKVIVELNECHA